MTSGANYTPLGRNDSAADLGGTEPKAAPYVHSILSEHDSTVYAQYLRYQPQGNEFYQAGCQGSGVEIFTRLVKACNRARGQIGAHLDCRSDIQRNAQTWAQSKRGNGAKPRARRTHMDRGEHRLAPSRHQGGDWQLGQHCNRVGRVVLEA
jgi:hypothetical protein